jgi:hypothetical protein
VHLAGTPQKQDLANSCYCDHPESSEQHRDQEVGLEGTSAGLEGAEPILNPSRCVKDALTWGMFATDSADGVGSAPEEVETAHEDKQAHVVDSSPFVPNHDDPIRILDRLGDH